MENKNQRNRFRSTKNRIVKRMKIDQILQHVKTSKLFTEFDRRMRLPFLPSLSLVKTGAVLKVGFFVVSAGMLGYKYLYPASESTNKKE